MVLRKYMVSFRPPPFFPMLLLPSLLILESWYCYNYPGVNIQSHTKNCTSCQGALKNVKKALTAAKTSVVVSFAWVRKREI